MREAMEDSPMTDQPTVRLVIRLYRGVRREEQATLVRDVRMGHLPGVGEEVEVTEDGGVTLDVTRRHWDFDGQAFLYLEDIFTDPVDDTRLYSDERAWNTNRDGDPVDLFQSNGWERTL